MKPFILLQKQHQRDSDHDFLAEVRGSVYPFFSSPLVLHFRTGLLLNLKHGFRCHAFPPRGRTGTTRSGSSGLRMCRCPAADSLINPPRHRGQDPAYLSVPDGCGWQQRPGQRRASPRQPGRPPAGAKLPAPTASSWETEA